MLSRRPSAGHSIFGSLFYLLFQQISVILSWNVSSFGRISANVKPFLATEVISDWNYDMHGRIGPLNWSKKYPECNWRSQSPVDLPPNSQAARHSDCTLPISLELLNYSRTVAGKLVNNGVQLMFEINASRQSLDSRPKLRSTFLNTDYVLEKVIFHWGNSSHEGSEHAVDGGRFPFEVQLYHRPLRSKMRGSRHRVAIALLGKRSYRESESLRPLVEFLPIVREPGDNGEINIKWASLLPSEVIQQFYLYHGSYTFPPCNEDVTWIVLPPRELISDLQLQAFRGLYQTSPNLVNAYRRPIQALHERQVYTSCLAELEETNMGNWGSGSVLSRINPYYEHSSSSSSATTTSTFTSSSHNVPTPRPPHPTTKTSSMWQHSWESNAYTCAPLTYHYQLIYFAILGFTKYRMLS